MGPAGQGRHVIPQIASLCLHLLDLLVQIFGAFGGLHALLTQIEMDHQNRHESEEDQHDLEKKGAVAGASGAPVFGTAGRGGGQFHFSGMQIHDCSSCCFCFARTESHSGDKIAADSPWFDSKTIDVDVNVDSSRKVDYASTSLVGADEKYLVVMTTGSYTLPDDFDWESMNYNDYMINNLSVIDKASNQTVSRIELAKNLGSDEFIDRAFYRDGMLTVKYGAFDAVTFDPVYTLKE